MERDPQKRRIGEARFALVMTVLFVVAALVELFADKNQHKGAVPVLLGMAVASSIRSYRRWTAPPPTAHVEVPPSEPEPTRAASSAVAADQELHRAAQQILHGDDPRVQ